MNLADEMRQISQSVTEREKLDILFEKLVLPRIKATAEKKENEVSFSTFNSTDVDKEVKKIMPKQYSLQDLVGGLMKPYLEEKGFKVILCEPSYYTYIRW